MRIALVSLDQAWEDRRANLERCAAALGRAARLGADLVVFPEMTLTGFTMAAERVAESAHGSGTVRAFGELARRHGTGVVFGVVLEGRERPRNVLVVVGADGAERARYAKVHPFTYAGEARHYEGGEELVTVELCGVRFGLSICYDLRFAEPYAALAADVDAFLVIANWPARRVEHWTVLLQARAIETQSYVLGVNRVGNDGSGIAYVPSSRTYDPRGAEVRATAVEADVAVYEIDPAVVAEYRAAFPVLGDRRPDVYARRPPTGSQRRQTAEGERA